MSKLKSKLKRKLNSRSSPRAGVSIQTVDGHAFTVPPCCAEACRDNDWFVGEDGLVYCCQNPAMQLSQFVCHLHHQTKTYEKPRWVTVLGAHKTIDELEAELMQRGVVVRVLPSRRSSTRSSHRRAAVTAVAPAEPIV